MKVLKFGGTSVGSAERIQRLTQIVPSKEPVIVVLSAMAGVTNQLVESAAFVAMQEKPKAVELLKQVEKKHEETCNELFRTSEFKMKGKELIKKMFHKAIDMVLAPNVPINIEKEILALGELSSTTLFHLCLQEQQVSSALIPALGFMRIDKDGEPDLFYIIESLNRLLDACYGINIIITQGFICRNAKGHVDNLKRGGSDYSAAIIGNAIDANEVQIWTDIDGFHNNDPRYVSGTSPISELSFDEAAELAYFGAKILHPSTIHPCREKGIPVLLKNTLNPTDQGTRITSSYRANGIRAVASKDGITAIRIKSLRMLMAYGFLKRVFDVFAQQRTAVDLITTSEVAITLTVDDTSNLSKITEELREFSSVEVTHNHSIICIVGDFVAEKPGIASQVFNAIKHIPIGLISYGGSSHNISILVSSSHKQAALMALQTVVLTEVTIEQH